MGYWDKVEGYELSDMVVFGEVDTCMRDVHRDYPNLHVMSYHEHEAACWEAVPGEWCVLSEVSYYLRQVQSLLLSVRGSVHWLPQLMRSYS